MRSPNPIFMAVLFASTLVTACDGSSGRVGVEFSEDAGNSEAGLSCSGGVDDITQDWDFCEYNWVCSNDDTYKVVCNVNPDPNTCTCYVNSNATGVTFEDNGICGDVTVGARSQIAAQECGWDLGLED